MWVLPGALYDPESQSNEFDALPAKRPFVRAFLDRARARRRALKIPVVPAQALDISLSIAYSYKPSFSSRKAPDQSGPCANTKTGRKAGIRFNDLGRRFDGPTAALRSGQPRRTLPCCRSPRNKHFNLVFHKPTSLP